ncbi:uncharacterized protein LOC131929590 [Physella acuta]|uniref:uncharacterized protein LOC131929590 n=1 Tax=Physella acuta TaxID=109671 RepID=UPI0027DB4CE9|nr:uncharacterized protein LOC131929590 [Physella acuta]
MAFRDTSILWKVAICIQALGLLLTIIGFSTNYLVLIEIGGKTANAGLWKFCDMNDKCYDTSYLKYQKYDMGWLDASKGLMAISLCAEFVTILMTSLSLLMKPTKLVPFATAATAFFSALAGIIGVAVATGELKSIFTEISKLTYDVGWSFVLFMVSQAVYIASGSIHLLDSRGMEGFRAGRGTAQGDASNRDRF